MPDRHKVTVFSESDLAVLRRVIDSERNRGGNTRNRARTENSYVDNVDHQAPECYVAWPNGAPGIPGLTEEIVGTAIVATPGAELCYIYKLLNGVLVNTGISKLVRNASGRTIPQEWVVVQRDKYGIWWVVGGGSATIPVRITEDTTGTTGTGSLAPKIAITKTSHLGGFSAIAVDEDYNDIGDVFTVYADELINVHWTDRIVRVARLGSKWQVVTTGVNYWEECVTQGAIASPGGAAMGELFTDGPIVPVNAEWTLPALTVCGVWFDDEQQKYVVLSPRCAAYAGTGTGIA